MGKCGLYHNVLRIKPPLCITKRDRTPFRYAIALRSATRSHSYSLIFYFILISTYAERITYLQNTPKFLDKQY